MKRLRRQEFALRSGIRSAAYSLAVLAILTGCASLAVTPCDTIPDRDGKYFGRFFLGVATLGLSEVTIQQEEIRQAYQGSPGCPPPAGVQVVPAATQSSAGGPSVALGTLVNGAPWTIAVYLNQDPDVRWDVSHDVPGPERQSPACLPTWTTPPGGAPERRATRHAAECDLETTARDRPSSAGIQAPVQRGRLQISCRSRLWDATLVP